MEGTAQHCQEDGGCQRGVRLPRGRWWGSVLHARARRPSFDASARSWPPPSLGRLVIETRGPTHSLRFFFCVCRFARTCHASSPPLRRLAALRPRGRTTAGSQRTQSIPRLSVPDHHCIAGGRQRLSKVVSEGCSWRPQCVPPTPNSSGATTRWWRLVGGWLPDALTFKGGLEDPQGHTCIFARQARTAHTTHTHTRCQ